MKENKLVKTFVLCIGMLVAAGSAMAGLIKTQTTVTPGVWTSDYYGALAYSQANNVPMFVFWANKGCTHCEEIEKGMNKAYFTNWMAEKRILMVFIEKGSNAAASDVSKWIKANALRDVKKYPFAAVYWPKNSVGKEVLVGFSAYNKSKDMVELFGASSKLSNIDQIIYTIESLITGWSPDGIEPGPTPEPEPEDDRTVIDPVKFFKKAMTLDAVAYQGDDLFGRVTVSLGKYNQKKKYLKATFKITSFAGKTYSKSVNVEPDKHGDILGVTVKYGSPIGEVDFNLINNEGTYEIIGEGDKCFIETGLVTIGGSLEDGEVSFSASFDELEPENGNYDFIVDAPSFVSGTVKNGKTLNFGSAPKISYKKYREDGETWYELTYDEDRPNTNNVKITYKPATGAFTGSFSIYASNAESIDSSKKPTLKTYKAKVSGYVVNGVGVGEVSVKVGKTTYVGTCSLD